jgi:hypothetical protein
LRARKLMHKCNRLSKFNRKREKYNQLKRLKRPEKTTRMSPFLTIKLKKPILRPKRERNSNKTQI